MNIPEDGEKIEVKSPEELEKEEIDEEIGDFNEVIDSDSEDDDVVEVHKMEWNGKEYLRDDTGTVYDVETQEPIGDWRDDEDRVALYNCEV